MEQFCYGLRPKLKAGTEHKFDSIKEFNKLRNDIRITEEERRLSSCKDESKYSAASRMSVTSSEQSANSMQDLRDLVASLGTKFDTLHTEVRNLSSNQNPGKRKPFHNPKFTSNKPETTSRVEQVAQSSPSPGNCYY